MAQGETNFEAGTILDISAGMVKKHLENIYKKLIVEGRNVAPSGLLMSSVKGMPPGPRLDTRTKLAGQTCRFAGGHEFKSGH